MITGESQRAQTSNSSEEAMVWCELVRAGSSQGRCPGNRCRQVRSIGDELTRLLHCRRRHPPEARVNPARVSYLPRTGVRSTWNGSHTVASVG